GDDAVAEGADGFDVAGGAAEHLLGFVTDGKNLLLAPAGRDRHHGGLVEDDAAAFDVYQGIGRAEVDGHIGRHETHQTREHRVRPLSNRNSAPLSPLNPARRKPRLPLFSDTSRACNSPCPRLPPTMR